MVEMPVTLCKWRVATTGWSLDLLRSAILPGQQRGVFRCGCLVFFYAFMETVNKLIFFASWTENVVVETDSNSETKSCSERQ